MDPLQLLTTVNSFYDQAFNKLLIVTFGVIAFIGILVPLVVGWVQMRTIRTERESMLRDLKAEVDREREVTRESIESSVREEMTRVRADLELRIEHLRSELEKSSAAAKARAFHLQGRGFKDSERPFLAIDDFALAACLYIDAADEANAQRCIAMLINDVLPKTSGKHYKKFKAAENCGDLLEKLRECNENGRYSNSIQLLEQAMASASTRDPLESREGGA